MSNDEQIVIIGGGVIGVCSAYYLAKQGWDVAILEKDEVGGVTAASYGNAGNICPCHCIPLAQPGTISQGLLWLMNPESPFYIRPTLDFGLLAWLWGFRAASTEAKMRKSIPFLRDLQRISKELYVELAKTEELDCHFTLNGALNLYKSSAALEKSGREVKMLSEEFGLQMAVIDREAVRKIAPNVHPDIVGAIHYQEDGHIDPKLFVENLAKRLTECGVKLYNQTEVLTLEAVGRRISAIKTTRGVFHPAQVVLAAGAWSPLVVNGLGLRLPIQPAKGYGVTINKPSSFPNIPLMLGESRVVVTPMGSRLRIAGTLELAGYDFSINQRRLNAVLKPLNDYILDIGEVKPLEIWRGQRPCPPDGMPIIGRPASYDNLVVASGHSYLGMSLGPATGKLVGQLISHEDPMVDLTPVRVDRF